MIAFVAWTVLLPQNVSSDTWETICLTTSVETGRITILRQESGPKVAWRARSSRQRLLSLSVRSQMEPFCSIFLWRRYFRHTPSRCIHTTSSVYTLERLDEFFPRWEDSSCLKRKWWTHVYSSRRYPLSWPCCVWSFRWTELPTSPLPRGRPQ